MTLVFDTSILIDIEKGIEKTLVKIEELSRMYKAPVQITFISYYEFLRGLKIGKPKKYRNLLEFINNFNMVKITKKTADILSNLKIKYDSLGVILSLTDLLIASQVIENNLILVTKNNHFLQIEELNKIILQ